MDSRIAPAYCNSGIVKSSPSKICNSYSNYSCHKRLAFLDNWIGTPLARNTVVWIVINTAELQLIPEKCNYLSRPWPGFSERVTYDRILCISRWNSSRTATWKSQQKVHFSSTMPSVSAVLGCKPCQGGGMSWTYRLRRYAKAPRMRSKLWQH